MLQELDSKLRALSIGTRFLVFTAILVGAFAIGWMFSSLWINKQQFDASWISQMLYEMEYDNILFLLTGAIVFLIFLIISIYIMEKKSMEGLNPLLPAKITGLLFLAGIGLSSLSDQVRHTMLLAIEDPSGISQFIIAIMLLGLSVIIYHFIFLHKEYGAFLRIKSIVSRMPVEDLDGINKIMSLMNDSTGLLKDKWLNLKYTLEADLSPDYELLISFHDQRELLKEYKLGFIVKILPIIGMLGTILGFTLAVVGMQTAAVNMSDFFTFKGNLLDALGGMKVAFLTTLMGLISMAIVMWLNSQIEEVRRHILLLEAELLYIHVYLPWKKHFRSKAIRPDPAV